MATLQKAHSTPKNEKKFLVLNGIVRRVRASRGKIFRFITPFVSRVEKRCRMADSSFQYQHVFLSYTRLYVITTLKFRQGRSSMPQCVSSNTRKKLSLLDRANFGKKNSRENRHIFLMLQNRSVEMMFRRTRTS